MSDVTEGREGKSAGLFEEGDGDAGAEELAEMLCTKLAEGVEHVDLDLFLVLLRLAGDVGDEGGGEICAVDGIVDGYGDLVLGGVVDGAAGDAGPHGLDGWDEMGGEGGDEGEY